MALKWNFNRIGGDGRGGSYLWAKHSEPSEQIKQAAWQTILQFIWLTACYRRKAKLKWKLGNWPLMYYGAAGSLKKVSGVASAMWLWVCVCVGKCVCDELWPPLMAAFGKLRAKARWIRTTRLCENARYGFKKVQVCVCVCVCVCVWKREDFTNAFII